MEGYLRISSKLKLGTAGEDYAMKTTSAQQPGSETNIVGPSRTGRIAVRLLVRNVGEYVDDLGEVPPVDSWDKISYINRPVEIHYEEGKLFTLNDALKTLLPEFFPDDPSIDEKISRLELEDEPGAPETCEQGQDQVTGTGSSAEVGASLDRHQLGSTSPSCKLEVKLVRIQGIEPKLDIPFSWVVTNLMNPEHFLHISVCVGYSLQHDPVKTR